MPAGLKRMARSHQKESLSFLFLRVLMLDLLPNFAEGTVGSFQFLSTLPVVAVDHKPKTVPYNDDVLVSDWNVLARGEVMDVLLLVLGVFLDD